jgi:phosphoadenosine phosphosulfate reductase
MVFEPEKLIEQAIRRYKENIAVACSFGKDSIVVLHMALKFNPNIKVVFNNTGVEFPENIKYKEKIKKLWNLNLIETKPIKTFWQCIEEYGVPDIRVKNKGSNTPMCCIYCKEKPADKVYKDNKIIAIMTGITAEESRQRKLLIARYDNKDDSHDNVKFCGQRYYMRSSGFWKLHPIVYWREEDVWRYIKENNIPINPVYQKWGGIYDRVGCLPCTAYRFWEQRLSKSHPVLFKRMKYLQDPQQMTLQE